MDDFGLLVGQYLSALPTLSDQQMSELQLDSSGRLIISGRYLEDAAHGDGDAGIFMLAVRHDADTSMVGADGDYAPLQVDENGRLKVVADIEVANGHEKAEDSAHQSADIGSYVLSVRSDSRPTNTNTSADGDYASFFVNANGELYVKDTDALTKLTEIDTVLDNIYIDTQAMVVDLAAIEVLLTSIDADTAAMVVDLAAIEVLLTSIDAELADQGTTLDNIETSIDNIESDVDSWTKAEDAAASTGEAGIPIFAVRHDSEGSLVDAEYDYGWLQLDAYGRLRTAAVMSAPGSEQYTVTDALAAAGDGLETITAAATPWVTAATISVGAGTTAYLYGYQWACDQNAQMRIVTDDTVDIKVYKTDINSSANPGTSEQFSESGRIEIAGAENLAIKLQIKKRHSSGGNANGTGSMHIRTF